MYKHLTVASFCFQGGEDSVADREPAGQYCVYKHHIASFCFQGREVSVADRK